MHLALGQGSATPARPEHGIVRPGLVPNRCEQLPRTGGQEHHARSPALTVDSRLPATFTLGQVTPAQPTQLRNPQAPTIHESEENSVSELWLKSDHAQGVGFRHDALGESVLHGRRLHHLPHVKAKIPDLLREAEKRFYGRSGVRAGGRSSVLERLEKALQIPQPNRGNRPAYKRKETLSMAAECAD
jgi:hypothetical protein